MGAMCREFTVVDGRRLPALLTTAAGLCEPCRRWARRSVRALPTDWCKLKLTIGESRALVSDKTRRPKPGPKVPLNVASDALMGDIVDTASSAAAVVAFALNIARRRSGYAGGSSGHDYRLLFDSAELVSENIDQLTTTEDGLQYVRRMVMLHSSVRRHLGETMQRERQHLPCPFCGGVVIKEVRDLRGRTSSSIKGTETPEIIRCTSCDNGPNQDGTWTEAEYRWLSTQVLSEREEINVLKWLLAEAQWERDVHAWLAAQNEWALNAVADDLSIDGGAAELVERCRRVAAVRA
ncbi:MAG: hypothetical protein CK431_04425 [Mycobacterium sp.]|nr:MAG: hypothetical protein CK431_04425 [Mycobacterium sp.]